MTDPVHVRYGLLRESVRIRIVKRSKGKTSVQHSSYYRLAPACLNDVGHYYCAREDSNCLCGFAGRGALAAHLRPNGLCVRCGTVHDDGKQYMHRYNVKDDRNPAEHVLLWICRYHGPEVMRPMDGDEPVNPDIRALVTNQQWNEYMQRLAERGAAPAVGKVKEKPR